MISFTEFRRLSTEEKNEEILRKSFHLFIQTFFNIHNGWLNISDKKFLLMCLKCLFEILRELLSRCLPTVFSLNDELKDLKKTLNEAVDKMAKVEVRSFFKNPDYSWSLKVGAVEWWWVEEVGLEKVSGFEVLLELDNYPYSNLRPRLGWGAPRPGAWIRSWTGAGARGRAWRPWRPVLTTWAPARARRRGQPAAASRCPTCPASPPRPCRTSRVCRSTQFTYVYRGFFWKIMIQYPRLQSIHQYW